MDVHSGYSQAQMECGLWSNNREVGTTEGRRNQIEEQASADMLASWWPDWNHAPVVAVPQLFIDVYLPRLRLVQGPANRWTSQVESTSAQSGEGRVL